MPITIIIFIISFIIMIWGAIKIDGNSSYFPLWMCSIFVCATSLGFSIATPHSSRLTPVTANITKTPTAVIVEAEVEGKVLREIFTDISTYSRVDSPNIKVYFKQRFNVWGFETFSDLIVETATVKETK